MNTQTQYIKRPPTREAWLDAIRPYIGGSEVAPLAGASKFQTAIDLFLDKTGRKARTDEPTEAMRLGNYLEQYAADRYTDKTGRTLRNYGYIVTRGHARADVDRLVVPEGSTIASFHEEIRAAGIVECKAVRDDADWDGEVPLYYQTQAQLYMELLDLPWVDFSVVFKASSVHVCPADFDWLRVERDRDIGAELCRRIEEFWTRCIVPDDAEAVTPFVRSLAEARALYPRAVAVEKTADADTAGRVKTLRAIEADIKTLTAQADKLKGEIAAFMGEADTLRDEDGKKLVTFKAPKPSEKTDWKAALVEVAERAKIDPMLVAEARANHSTVAPPSRRFLLCAEKGGAK